MRSNSHIYSFNGENDYQPSDEAPYYGWTPEGIDAGSQNGGITPGDPNAPVTGPKGPQQMSDEAYAAMMANVFGQSGASSGAPGPVHNDYPATPGAPAGGSTNTPGLMADFSSALRTLINGPSPKQAGMDVMKSAPVTAFNANAKRNEARDRQFLAERAAAGGYSGSGGFDSGVLGLRARTNEAMDRFAGEQANTQEQGRRDELMRALSMALAFGDAESARALQRELGLGSLDVQRYGISTGRDTALDQLGYNYANMQNNLNQNLIDWFK
jgi:hypothetical protein